MAGGWSTNTAGQAVRNVPSKGQEAMKTSGGGSSQSQKSLSERVLSSALVESTNKYSPNANIDRTYLTLSGNDRGYRGDASTQVYIDNKTGKLHIKRASKGMVSRGLEESLGKLREQFPEAVVS